ncbi:MAG: dTDP-glucose 4,6-dehydratase [Candidatus Dormibacterales bacterium]
MSERRLEHLLVAGGAGFIGSNFVRLLRRTRPAVAVTVLDKLTYAGNPANLAEFEGTPGYRFVKGDICDRELVGSLAGEVDAIVDFAAETHVDRSLLDPFAFVSTDVYGTAVLCEAARARRHQVFLLVSTDEVYGHVPQGRSREGDRLLPRSPYAASKAGGELLARSYRESFGLPLLVTRGANNYGPRQYPEKIVPLFITNALDGMSLPVYGDGSAVRDYIHVDDHCRAIDLVLHRGEPGQAYNVGTGVGTSGLQVARAVAELLDLPPGRIEHVADRAGHDYRYALDSSKLEALGWRATVDFSAGIKATVEWYQEHEDWWRPLKSGEYWDYYRRNYRPLDPAGAGSGAGG